MDANRKGQELLKDSGKLSLASSNSVGRNKVALKPGRSLMDWMRLTHASNDLAGTCGKIVVVSVQELQTHNNINDAWICVNGKVYNVTPYLEFHPGGESELMRGVGRDATDLFNQIHRWVNAESMLQKCYVGPLRSSALWLQPAPVISNKKGKKSNLGDVPSLNVPIPDTAIVDLKIDLDQNDEHIHVVINNVGESVQKHQVIVHLTDKVLKVMLKLRKLVCQCHVTLTDAVRDNYTLNVDEKFVQVLLPKVIKGLWSDIGSSEFNVRSSEESDQTYHSCTLLEKVPVTHNTVLLSFRLPLGSTMHVPVGHHIHIKEVIEDVEVVRSYTPIIPSLFTPMTDATISDGHHLHLMVKIYSDGLLTPILNNCEIGKRMPISTYTGNFSLEKVNKCSMLVMLAAGTGFTPMIKLIHLFSQPAREKKMKLFFFNRSEKEILWKDELDLLSEMVEFSVCHILSEPSNDWHSETGIISRQLLEKLLPSPAEDDTFFCVCGPPQFTKAALKYLEELEYRPENIHSFTG